MCQHVYLDHVLEHLGVSVQDQPRAEDREAAYRIGQRESAGNSLRIVGAVRVSDGAAIDKNPASEVGLVVLFRNNYNVCCVSYPFPSRKDRACLVLRTSRKDHVSPHDATWSYDARKFALLIDAFPSPD